MGALLAGACSDLKKVERPEDPSPSEGVIAAVPSPRAPSSPTPPPTSPSPNPSPSPSAPPPQASCNLPPGTGTGENCERTSPSFLSDVEAAIDQIVGEHPEWFDKNDTKCPNCYKVLDPERFVDRLLEVLAGRGLCAISDGEEIAVKNSNDFNDQYDVLTGDLYLRRGDGSYRSTCRPAAF